VYVDLLLICQRLSVAKEAVKKERERGIDLFLSKAVTRRRFTARMEFYPRVVHAEFLVHKMALQQASLRVLHFLL
jgi:hypothetical protein